MPVVKNITPDWLKPENASVFDPLYLTLLRKALHITGMDTPEGQLQTFLNPTPTGLISAYTNKQERSAATELFKKAAEAMGPQVKAAGEAFASRYPRIAAHINLKKAESYVPNSIKGYPTDVPALGYARTADFAPQHGVKQMEVGITPEGMRNIDHPPVGYGAPSTYNYTGFHKLAGEVSDVLKGDGISLDTSFGPTGNMVRLRKWGAPNTPENIIDPSTLNKEMQEAIASLKLGPEEYARRHQGVANAKNTLFHEGTHVAQKLGNKDFNSLYHMGNEMVGYEKNPFELAASDAGKAASMGDRNISPVKATGLLDAQAHNRITGNVKTTDPNITKNAEWIKKLLAYRASKGWKPKGYDKPLQTFNEILERNKGGMTSQMGERPIEKDLLMPAVSHLPTDLASRMERASEQGFTTDVYHGTRSSFNEFDPARVKSGDILASILGAVGLGGALSGRGEEK